MSATARLVRNMLSTYSALDSGRSSGRDSTSRNLDWNWRRLQAALEAGGFEELDTDPTLARNYSKLERRHLTR